MLHSFVVCAYGESTYIEECICSILKQTQKSKLLIATSTDNQYLRDISNKYDIPLHINDHDPDIAKDWNSAIELADTKYVTIAHQDDVYDPTYVECVLQAAEEYKDTQIVFSDYYEIRGEEKVYKNRNLKVKELLLSPLKCTYLQSMIFFKRAVISIGNAICCPSVTYVKENIPKELFRTGMRSNIDWQAWEELSGQKGRFLYICQPLMGHRIHEESTTSEVINGTKRDEEDLKMLQKFWPSPIAKLINSRYRSAQVSNQEAERHFD